MRTKILLFCLSISWFSAFGQDDKWETQKQITGYLSFEGNYFNNLKFFEREDFAISMPEAGILFNYQPLKKLSFKSVFVYRPTWELRNMISEISAEWEENRFLKIKVGHQLSSLSPINTAFYAPVNTGIVLPMIVSVHDFYPTNMEALSVSGSIGNKLKIDYYALGGGYFASFMLRNGAMSFFGVEDYYFRALKNDTTLEDLSGFINTDNLYYGLGGHLRFSYDDYAMIGLNTFRASEFFSFPSSIGTIQLDILKQAYGINFKFQYNSLKLIGEAWTVSVKDQDNFASAGRNGLFIEFSNSFDHLTPYVKHESRYLELNRYSGTQEITKYTRYVVGLNYKPIFEATLKLEYFAYDTDHLNGILMAIIFAF